MSSSNRSRNIVFLMGNIGTVPELKVIGDGTPVCNFSVATSERYKGADGKYQDAAQWHRCEVWGSQAEFLVKYASKGDLVDIQGQIRYRSYEKDGDKKQTTNIRVERIILLGKTSWRERNTDAAPTDGQGDIAYDAEVVDNSDIPF